MQDQLKEVRAIFESHLDRLQKQGHESAIRFETYTVDGNAGRDAWKEQNTLKLRSRREGNALMLEWYRRKWTRDGDGKRGTLHTYIRKRNTGKSGSVYSYDLDDLFKYAPDWSRAMVIEIEKEASTLRRQARYCSSILVTIGRLERYLAHLDGADLPEEEEA